LSGHDKPHVVVGMSGGVDSSVSAALLKDQGYEVTGIMLRLWSDDKAENRCCAPDAQIEARQVAAQLEIPFYIIDAQTPFYQAVVEPFINGYTQGFTPNPCLNCNKFIRWGFLRERAQAFGAHFIATGHYARTKQDQNGKYQLLKNPDPEKDQSYFLHVLTQEDLRKTIFPLADLSKAKVRQLAESYNLSVSTRPDSQDLCFVGGSDYREFLRKMDPESITPGPILDIQGNLLSEHSGLADYTIGQRKGLEIAGPEPYYVIRKDLEKNSLIIGPRSLLGNDHFYVSQPNWIFGEKPVGPVHAEIRIRYKSRAVPGTITPIDDQKVKVVLETSLPDISPGQAAVFYQEDICLGGGKILQEEV